MAPALMLADAPRATLPLGEAALCLDCDQLFNIRAGQCPRCASVYMQLVSTWVTVDVRGREASGR